MPSLDLSQYEDTIREKKKTVREEFSPFCDFRLVPSSITPGVTFAVKVTKPVKPAVIKAGTHGWHMSVKKFEPKTISDSPYLQLDIDMRGRAYSTGMPDCNGYELYDIFDAVNFARREYSNYISDPDVVYFESGSGGGGNALALAGKFPDLFCAINALVPISDYYEWYIFDRLQEFRDEMDVWIGVDPAANKEAYDARSGITLVSNLLTHIFISHGTHDMRVPYFLTRNYMDACHKCGKSDLVTLLTLDGVGTREHYGNISEEQMAEMKRLCRENLETHTIPVNIPPKGKFVVAGYLVTKHFSVFLSSLNQIDIAEYDLTTKKISLQKSKDAKIVWNVSPDDHSLQ